MRALLTAVIAATEAAAAALAVFAVIAVPAVLVWWFGFDLAAEPEELAATVAALWQMTHLVPMQVTVSAPAALSLGLTPAALMVPFSLAPLALTLVTILLATRSGMRFADRGGSGAWALLGGTVGFAAAAGFAGVLAAGSTAWPQWARIALPAAVYAVPLLFGFVLRSAREQQEWWASFVRRMQQGASRIAPVAAAVLPERATQTLRLAAAALASLLMLGTIGFTVALMIGYSDVITLSQGLQLDALGVLALFLVQLMFLPTAWVWTVAWFAGSGFSVGLATSVTPFETLLGPLPALPLFGAIPPSWGWLGGLAPAIIVAIGTVLGGFAGGRPAMRRASALVSVLVPICAALLAGLVVALCCVLASGAIGPGRLAANGPGWWQTGGLVALELAFGMSLGVFARRSDAARLRDLVPAALREEELQGAERQGAEQQGEKLPGGYGLPREDPLPRADPPTHTTTRVGLPADEQPTVEIEPLEMRVEDRAAEDVRAAAAPAIRPEVEPDEAADPLLEAFSWETETPARAAEASRDWRSRMRSKWNRD